MRRKTFLAVLVGSTITLFSGHAYSLRCESPDPGETVSDSTQMDLRGTADTLLVIGSEIGMDSPKFKTRVEDLYAGYPSGQRSILRNQLVYFFCSTLADASDLGPAAKAALLRQFTGMIREIDPPARAPADTATVPLESDPQRVVGDWNCLREGPWQCWMQRIAMSEQGGIVIEPIAEIGKSGRSGPALSFSEVRLEGSTLRYNIHFPSGETLRAQLQIIYRDLMVGTYSSTRSAPLRFELRRRESADQQVVTTESGAPEGARSTASNAR